MPCFHSLVSLPGRLPALLFASLDRMRLTSKPGLMVSEGHTLSSDAGTLTTSFHRAARICQAGGVMTSAASSHPVVAGTAAG